MGMIKKQIWYDLFAKQLAKHFSPVHAEKRNTIRQHFVSTNSIQTALTICLTNMEAYSNAVGQRIEDSVDALEKERAVLLALPKLPFYDKKKRVRSRDIASLTFKINALEELYASIQDMEPAETLDEYKKKLKPVEQ